MASASATIAPEEQPAGAIRRPCGHSRPPASRSWSAVSAPPSRSPLRTLPSSIWVVEILGIALVAGAGFAQGYVQALGLAIGVALLLAVPLGFVQRVLEERLATRIEQAVSESVTTAASKRLSGPEVPMAPEELDLWPFAAVVERQTDSRVRLRLRTNGSVLSSTQPIEVMIVVTDPAAHTFSTACKLQSIVEQEVAEWIWPDDFTSGDIRDGEHSVEFFVAPLSAGPARRFGLVASSAFVYSGSAGGSP